MPCNSDHMSATPHEKNLSIIYGLLDEVETGRLPKDFGYGYDPRVYCRNLSKEHLDQKTEELCSKLQQLEVSKFSLEMQMWWRDHQKADEERLRKEIEFLKTQEDIDIALSKLTEYERKLLGF